MLHIRQSSLEDISDVESVTVVKVSTELNRKTNNNNNKEDFYSALLLHKVGAQSALQ